MLKIGLLRQMAGLKQKDIASALGVTQGLISMWESGRATPPTKFLPELAKVLNCEVSDLF
ncbi:MAG: helix-turn-helix domain-containing protein [Monoglobaceae bacterium]